MCEFFKLSKLAEELDTISQGIKQAIKIQKQKQSPATSVQTWVAQILKALDQLKYTNVNSFTNEEGYWVVNIDKMECTCPHFFHRLSDVDYNERLVNPSKQCKHLRKAIREKNRYQSDFTIPTILQVMENME